MRLVAHATRFYAARRISRRDVLAIYAYVRHPQYVGFILVMFGFPLRWPTLLTLAMFPVLVFMYVRLARSEEQMPSQFGVAYERYMHDVSGIYGALPTLWAVGGATDRARRSAAGRQARGARAASAGRCRSR